jgi:hypothetical protein
MEIMKLRDCRVALLQQLDIELRRDRLDVVGPKSYEKSVHRLAPAPEIVADGPGSLGEAGHRALKGVTVEVWHAGDGDAAERRGVAREPGVDRGDPSMRIHLNHDVVSESLRKKCAAGEIANALWCGLAHMPRIYQS